ncbi:MAG TPA: phosphoenolpyruvate carboxykinase (ATP) [Candidatus Limnocylindria bacterium]|nr:phosphoenolpyruvate carboxykinase (ATP) [Candidatus Limnocylindria bacterium]
MATTQLRSKPSSLTATYRNLSTAELYEHAIRTGEGIVSAHGSLVVRTGKHTGRSPKDKFVVREPSSQDTVWWGEINQPISEEHYDRLRTRLMRHVADRPVYSQDLYIGAQPEHRRSLRVFTETAWASIFARNLFRRPPAEDLDGFAPNFTIIDVPSFKADPSTEGVRSETAILVHLKRMEIIIVGTEYAGEIKKSAFTVMNYLLPDEGALPMHSSVNVGRDDDPALFFGLSGTGKTTLSADPERSLIGDDEHGWGADGLFNFEGGCYAKTIRLSPMYEPDIFATTRRFGTILENVDLDERTRELDLDSERFTENTRGAYPLEFIGNADPTGMTTHPRNVVFLTADAFGILPPISRLTRDQAQYHFISGYTAKLAGTEIGVTEPRATFSAGFGAPFLPRHPGEYARMLAERLERFDVPVWLVNTGWTGGPYGEGHRMRIDHTRVMVRAALSGALADVPYELDPIFGVEVPTVVPGVPSEVLRPRDTWADPSAYDAKARELARMFAANFEAYHDGVPEEVRAAGPRAE